MTAALDPLLVEIAEYVCDRDIDSDTPYETAHLDLLDALGCGFLALRYPECTKLLGPIVPGTVVPDGVRVPGTPYVLDPVKAAFDIGTMIRWLDFNDTWLALEWGHPSDNFGAILAAASHASSRPRRHGRPPLTVRDLLTAMIKADEIQGVLSLGNAFNRVGLDHVLLVRVASAAVATSLLGGTRAQVADAVSQAWVDGGVLRAYRHAPQTGPRKSWAAGDATSRGVRLALLTLAGEPGYPAVLSTPTWGFQDALLAGRKLVREREFGSYVIENVLFKVPYPAEFHAQTALEAAVRLHPLLADRVDEIAGIEITTHDAAVRIIDKTGPLHGPADRDHCLQYIVAVGLLRGQLTADDYEEAAAGDPRIDRLRDLTTVTENPAYSADYLDPAKRSVPSAVQVHLTDGTHTDRVAVEYPLGHPVRRAECTPALLDKFERNLRTRFPAARVERILALCLDREALIAATVPDFLEVLAP